MAVADIMVEADSTVVVVSTAAGTGKAWPATRQLSAGRVDLPAVFFCLGFRVWPAVPVSLFLLE